MGLSVVVVVDRFSLVLGNLGQVRGASAGAGIGDQATGELLGMVVGEELVPPAGGLIRSPYGDRVVMLLDSYERLGPLDGWVRDGLLPWLPASSITVLVGRLPPRREWRADAGWSELLRVVSLRNLHPEAARGYLDRRGVPLSGAR